MERSKARTKVDGSVRETVRCRGHNISPWSNHNKSTTRSRFNPSMEYPRGNNNIHRRVLGREREANLKGCCRAMGTSSRGCGCQTTMPAEAPCAPSLLLTFRNHRNKHKQTRGWTKQMDSVSNTPTVLQEHETTSQQKRRFGTMKVQEH